MKPRRSRSPEARKSALALLVVARLDALDATASHGQLSFAPVAVTRLERQGLRACASASSRNGRCRRGDAGAGARSCVACSARANRRSVSVNISATSASISSSVERERLDAAVEVGGSPRRPCCSGPSTSHSVCIDPSCMYGAVMPTLRSCGGLEARRCRQRFCVTRKRPSSERSVLERQLVDGFEARRSCCQLDSASARPSFSKSWCRADDADVVEAVVAADRVRRVERDGSVTQRALPLKSAQPCLRALRRDRRRVCPARKWSNGESRNTSVRSNAAMRAPDVVVVRRAAVGVLEQLLVLGVVGDRPATAACAVGLAHLDRIDDRQLRLLLERLGARPSRKSVRKKTAFSVVGALRRPSWSSMPFGHRPLVGETAADVVAGGARDGAVGATAACRSRASCPSATRSGVVSLSAGGSDAQITGSTPAGTFVRSGVPMSAANRTRCDAIESAPCGPLSAVPRPRQSNGRAAPRGRPAVPRGDPGFFSVAWSLLFSCRRRPRTRRRPGSSATRDRRRRPPSPGRSAADTSR